MSKLYKFLFAAALIFVLFVPIIIYLEIKNQKIFERTNKDDPAINMMILYSDQVSRRNNSTLHFRLLGRDAELLHSADVKRNNLGYFSNFDYKLEKLPNEFRIVVLGGEQTASSLSHTSWPDYLKKELEFKLKIPVSVINIAWPDAGPAHYIEQWQNEGEKFHPDLVIINYVETDFYRDIKGGPVKFKGKPIDYKNIEISIGDPPNNIAKLGLPIVSGSSAMSIADPDAIPARPYGFLVSPEFILQPEKIKNLQNRVVADMISGSTPCFGCLTWHKLIGNGFPSVAQLRDFDPPQSQQNISTDSLVKFGSEKFGFLIKNVPNPLIIHNFHYGELKQEFTLTEKMKEFNKGIKVIDMRTRIPPGISDETLRSWYLIPFMGEKWSDSGHKAYAKLVSNLVMDWREKRLAYY